VKDYEFALRFTLPSSEMHSDELIERLGDAGCDDALIGIGSRGRIALEFVRSADSARGAILSAIGDVMQAIPRAELVEVSPDLVGVTDVAALVGCSRQNIRKLMISPSSNAPAPLHEGSASLWHLAPVLDWLTLEKDYRVSEDLVEVSKAAMKVNAAVDALRTDATTREEVRALFA
jgi:hypothetical protein